MKAIKTALVALLPGILLVSCNMKPPGEEAAETQAASAESKARTVRISELAYRETAINLEVTSTVLAFEETYFAPSIPGRVRKVYVDVDDHVQKGQLLVEMDRTQLDQTQLQYQTLRTDLARMDTLLKHGSVTQQSYDQMKAQVETTELVLENLKENTLLRAPYSGVITGKYFNDGELFSAAPNTQAGKAAVVSMIQMDPVKLLVNLSEKNLPIIKEGIKAEVTTEVFPGDIFHGTIFRIHPTVNAATRTFAAEVKVPNRTGKLKPGMFARVSLKLGEREALIVPAIAVLQQAGTNQRYVMLHENGVARKEVVQIVARHDDQLEISTAGIKGGEELIIAGQSQLEEGSPVRVVVE